jgi:hypothetical protein
MHTEAGGVAVLVEQGEDVRADGDVVAAGTAIVHERTARDVTHLGEIAREICQ